MNKIIIPRSVAPWSISETAYNSREEYFWSVYLLTRADMLGECRVTFEMLASVLGRSAGTGNMPKIKREIKKVFHALASRNGLEKYTDDHMRLSFSSVDLDRAAKNTLLLLNVKASPSYRLPESFFAIEPDVIHKVSAAAREQHISPVELFCFYAYMREKMRTYHLTDSTKVTGCWLSVRRILDEYKISPATYMKYRETLANSKLMFSRSGKKTRTLTQFALEDNQEAWDLIEKAMTGANISGAI